jgi:DNA-binding NtrC family response regulator
MSLKGKEVLIIHTCNDLSGILENILANLGLTVSRSENISTAMKNLKNKPTQLIIIDIAFLHIESGHEFLVAKQKLSNFNEIPILMFVRILIRKILLKLKVWVQVILLLSLLTIQF